jgi:hypothetical protein
MATMTFKQRHLCRQEIPALLALGLTYGKDASAFTSLPFDFVATGLRTIQFLFLSKLLRSHSILIVQYLFWSL